MEVVKYFNIAGEKVDSITVDPIREMVGLDIPAD